MSNRSKIVKLGKKQKKNITEKKVGEGPKGGGLEGHGGGPIFLWDVRGPIGGVP